MVNQKQCPYCKTAARQGCEHLALAVPGRDFVQCCINAAHAARQWKALCACILEQNRQMDCWDPDREDFTWLETAFCNRFLKNLRWFGELDYEWRSEKAVGKAGFYVLLWSKSPARLWWELQDEVERELSNSRRLPGNPGPVHPDLFHVRPGHRLHPDA